jgi:hypothetical protein
MTTETPLRINITHDTDTTPQVADPYVAEETHDAAPDTHTAATQPHIEAATKPHVETTHAAEDTPNKNEAYLDVLEEEIIALQARQAKLQEIKAKSGLTSEQQRQADQITADIQRLSDRGRRMASGEPQAGDRWLSYIRGRESGRNKGRLGFFGTLRAEAAAIGSALINRLPGRRKAEAQPTVAAETKTEKKGPFAFLRRLVRGGKDAERTAHGAETHVATQPAAPAAETQPAQESTATQERNNLVRQYNALEAQIKKISDELAGDQETANADDDSVAFDAYESQDAINAIEEQLKEIKDQLDEMDVSEDQLGYYADEGQALSAEDEDPEKTDQLRMYKDLMEEAQRIREQLTGENIKGKSQDELLDLQDQLNSYVDQQRDIRVKLLLEEPEILELIDKLSLVNTPDSEDNKEEGFEDRKVARLAARYKQLQAELLDLQQTQHEGIEKNGQKRTSMTEDEREAKQREIDHLIEQQAEIEDQLGLEHDGVMAMYGEIGPSSDEIRNYQQKAARAEEIKTTLENNNEMTDEAREELERELDLIAAELYDNRQLFGLSEEDILIRFAKLGEVQIDVEPVDPNKEAKVAEALEQAGEEFRKGGPEAVRRFLDKLQNDPDFRDYAVVFAIKLGLRAMMGPVGIMTGGVIGALGKLAIEANKIRRDAKTEGKLQEGFFKKFSARTHIDKTDEMRAAEKEALEQELATLPRWRRWTRRGIEVLKKVGNAVKEGVMVFERIGYTLSMSANRKYKETGELAVKYGLVGVQAPAEGQEGQEGAAPVNEINMDKFADVLNNLADNPGELAKGLKEIKVLMRNLVDLGMIDFQIPKTLAHGIDQRIPRISGRVKLTEEQMVAMKGQLEAFFGNENNRAMFNGYNIAIPEEDGGGTVNGMILDIPDNRNRQAALKEFNEITQIATANMAYETERALRMRIRLEVVDALSILGKAFIMDGAQKALAGNEVHTGSNRPTQEQGGRPTQNPGEVNRPGNQEVGNGPAKPVVPRQEVSGPGQARDVSPITPSADRLLPGDWKTHMNEWMHDTTRGIRPPVGRLQGFMERAGHPLTKEQLNWLNHAYIGRDAAGDHNNITWYRETMKILGKGGLSADKMAELKFQTAAFRLVNQDVPGFLDPKELADLTKDAKTFGDVVNTVK